MQPLRDLTGIAMVYEMTNQRGQLRVSHRFAEKLAQFSLNPTAIRRFLVTAYACFSTETHIGSATTIALTARLTRSIPNAAVRIT